MVGRALIIVILALFAIAGFVSQRIGAAAKAQTENTVRTHQRAWGKSVAEMGVNLALRKLADDPSWRSGIASSGSPLPLYEGAVYVTASDVTFFGKPVVQLFSVATVSTPGVGARFDTSIAYVLKPIVNNATILGAITTNNDVNTLGTLNVDGRDHDTSGALIASSGRYGIWTTGAYSQDGNSKVGGTTTAGVDVTPRKNADSSVIAQHQAYPGGYPGSPDSVFGGPSNGFPEGTLKTIALSRMGGSQYATDPATLTFPLRGVTYLELPSGASWISPALSGSGILVIHNTAKNAIIKAFSGSFTGLIISDDVDKIHATVIGAIVSLTPAPASGNTIGNGTGDVYFSKRAIALASTSFLNTGIVGSKNAVLAWWE